MQKKGKKKGNYNKSSGVIHCFNKFISVKKCLLGNYLISKFNLFIYLFQFATIQDKFIMVIDNERHKSMSKKHQLS